MKCFTAYTKGCLYLIHSNAVEAIEIRSDSFTRITSSESGGEFDTSSTVSPTSHRACVSLAKPQVVGKTMDAILLSAETEEGRQLQLVKISASFPQDELTTSWSSLPSAISAPSTNQWDA